MIATILKVDLKRLFVTPQAWLLLAIAQLVIAWAYMREIEGFEAIQDRLLALESSLGFTALVAVPALLNGLNIIMLLTPLLGMRLIASERGSQRFDLLLAAPVSAAQIVWAKFLQLFFLLAGFWLVLLLQLLLLNFATGLDIGMLLLVWVMGLLVVATYSAAAVWISSLTRHPMLAAVAMFGLFILLRIAGAGEDEPGIFDWFSLTYHMKDAQKGLFNSADLAFLLMYIGLFLTLAWIRLLRLRPCRYLWTARFMLMGLLVAMVVSLPLLQQLRWTADVSATQQNTLKPATQSLLQRLSGELSFTAYVADASLQKKKIATLLAMYKRSKADLLVQYVDPASQPEAARALGITHAGELLVRYGNRQQMVKRVSEIHIAATLREMLEAEHGWILNLQGHDELNLSGKGLQGASMLSGSLRARGYRIRDYNINQLGSLPDNTETLIIGGASGELQPAELLEINRFLAEGGNLLWLLEPQRRPFEGLTLLPEIGVFPGVVVDGNAAAYQLARPDNALINEIQQHQVSRQLTQYLVFPQAAAFEATDPKGWTQQLSLQTGPKSWNETGEIEGTISPDPVMLEQMGPLQVGGLWQRQLDNGQLQRLAIIGDSDFIRNATLAKGDNLQFTLNLFYWLEGDAASDVTARVETIADQRLHMTALFRGLFSGVFLILMPLLLAVAGIVMPLLQRRRQNA